MDRSTLIITDSGGIQEEGPSLGKPVIVTRESTERPEAVESGLAVLAGNRTDEIVKEATQLLEGHRSLPCGLPDIYGDGRAAERIVTWMVTRLARRRSSQSEDRTCDRER
jgi:UDP-N-acetylglucosamine 2-epimerase